MIANQCKLHHLFYMSIQTFKRQDEVIYHSRYRKRLRCLELVIYYMYFSNKRILVALGNLQSGNWSFLFQEE